MWIRNRQQTKGELLIASILWGSQCSFLSSEKICKLFFYFFFLILLFVMVSLSHQWEVTFHIWRLIIMIVVCVKRKEEKRVRDGFGLCAELGLNSAKLSGSDKAPAVMNQAEPAFTFWGRNQECVWNRSFFFFFPFSFPNLRARYQLFYATIGQLCRDTLSICGLQENIRAADNFAHCTTAFSETIFNSVIFFFF